MAEAAYISDVSANFEAVTLADEPSGDSFELHRSLVFDDQDRGLGMDTHCLVRSGAAHYGGLLEWHISAGVLALRLTEAAAATLELPVATEIPVSSEAEAIVRAHFPRLLR